MKNRFRITFRLVLALVAGLFCASGVQADPLMFSNTVALQDGGFTSIPLATNPNITLMGPQISFRVDVAGALPPGATDFLQITYSEQNMSPIVQTYEIPLFGSVNPPFSFLFTLVSPNADAQGVAASLTLNLLNSNPDFIIPNGPNAGQPVDSYTYHFGVARPVPEPATLTLAGIGLGLLTARFRNRRASKNE